MGQWVDGSVGQIGKWVDGSVLSNGSVGQMGRFLCASHVSWLSRYLTTILRLSYDNVKVVIDLRPMSNLYKTSYSDARLSSVRFTCEIVIR